jgi:hypothetical protein
MIRALSTFAMLALLAGGTSRADAQPDTATATAEQLFREGKRLMGEGNFAAACDAFDGSCRKAPAVSTLLNLADCREKNQQYASAWSHFIEAGRQARSDPSLAAMYESAQRRAAAVEQRLSYLIINVPDDARIEGLIITRNGVPVDPAEWNRDIPVDGGEYRIEGKAPAYEPWSATVKVGSAKDKQSVNVPRFSAAITAPATTAPSVPADQPGTFTEKRRVAVGLWAVGAVALGGGLALELAARNTYEDAKTDSDNARRHQLTADANRQRHYAMAAGAAGVVAAGVGVLLWYSGRPIDHRVTVAPRVARDGGELVLMGHF